MHLEVELPDAFDDATLGAVSGADLGRARYADAEFEEPDGRPAAFQVDLVGQVRKPGEQHPAGPLADLRGGRSRVRVW